MHLDTVFTLCDCDLANVYMKGVSEINSFSFYPGKKSGSLDVRAEENLSWRSCKRR